MKNKSKYEMSIQGTNNFWEKQTQSPAHPKLKEKTSIFFYWYLDFGFEVSEKNFLCFFEDFKKQTGCKTFTIGIDNSYGYYDIIDSKLAFYGNREETDEEFASRLEGLLAAERRTKEIQKQAKKKQTDNERALYEKLKKKFEKV